MILYHGTSSNRAAKIVGNQFYAKQGFRPGRYEAVFFAEELSTARYFAFERMALTQPIPPRALTVIEFNIPENFVQQFGLSQRYIIGSYIGLRFPDIPGGSGFERILTRTNIRNFNDALKQSLIQVRRLRIR